MLAVRSYLFKGGGEQQEGWNIYRYQLQIPEQNWTVEFVAWDGFNAHLNHWFTM